MKITYKNGVYVAPELLSNPTALFHLDRMQQAALRMAPELVDDEMVVTSISREVEERFSYHGTGRALDIRTGLSNRIGMDTEDITMVSQIVWREREGAIFTEAGINSDEKRAKAAYEAAVLWADRIREALGSGYDVVFGIRHRHWSHIHIERDQRDG